MPSPEKSMEPAPERRRLCTREKPDVAVIRSRGKSKWQRSAALRSPLASAVGAQRFPASACRAFARAREPRRKPARLDSGLWRSARLRLVESCRVQTRSDLLFGSRCSCTHTSPLYYFIFFTPTQYGTFTLLLSTISHSSLIASFIAFGCCTAMECPLGLALGPCSHPAARKSSAGSLPADAKKNEITEP